MMDDTFSVFGAFSAAEGNTGGGNVGGCKKLAMCLCAFGYIDPSHLR